MTSSKCISTMFCVGCSAWLLAGIVNAQSGGQAQAKLQPRPSADGPALEFPFETVHVGTAEYDEGPTGVTVLYFPSTVRSARRRSSCSPSSMRSA